ncbi:hypothetical protein C5U62_32780 [Pseudomonas protegens]|uniref:Uncharacterized protein n=1 Tax=Pseudomonas protegens TaxID=380021 RepID=A0A2T6GAU6_9PSED|nr:hypothetical protein [Pseudomonas protegens]PUA41278.1 hypothetical protein C5U62_32780 [Pseudomonas protegens]
MSRPNPLELYQLPVILTPAAWQQAVHVAQPAHLDRFAERLGNVLKAAYLALQQHPDAHVIDFGLDCLPPQGMGQPVWLDLRLHILLAPCHTCLCISLPSENP